MRRKGDTALVPFEYQLLEAALALRASGIKDFYGYALLERLEQTGQLLGQGFSTLYRALRRLDEMGYLKSRWANSADNGGAGRPRRMYQLTGKGIEAANERETKPATLPTGKRVTI
jgi:DNA-binding PadR family transcriptional regulator